MRCVYLLLLLVAASFLSSAADTSSCVVGQDGTCLDEGAIQEDCLDEHEQCQFWADHEECDKNPKYMLEHCQKACGVCGHGNVQKLINSKLQKLEEETSKESDLTETPWGVTQDAQNNEVAQKHVDKMVKYMEETVMVDPGYEKVRNECKNRHPHCALWASSGECDANPTYMTLQCAPSCESCHLIDFDTRCPYDETIPSIWGPGDLNKMFERIAYDQYYQQFGPKILSMPSPTSKDILDGPWVVTLDNFVTDEECERLIALGAAEGYEASRDVGKKKFDGTYDGYANKQRTSTNAWCQDSCWEDSMTQQVLQKIENVTGVPDTNSEYLQLLRYEETQFYGTHHDYIPHHVDRNQGVRILTVFLYLNDVEAGGGTDFPTLGITVMPRRGKALIWPSVLDEDPNEKDHRTQHQALPVEKGIKYGANAWLHLKDFKSTFEKSCH